MEAHQQHGPKFVSFKLVMGGKIWNVVGCYLELRNAYNLESVVAAIGHGPRGVELLVSSDLNTDLEFLYGNEHDEAIEAAMATEELKYMTEHFLP